MVTAEAIAATLVVDATATPLVAMVTATLVDDAIATPGIAAALSWT
jgi:hypothetical protein